MDFMYVTWIAILIPPLVVITLILLDILLIAVIRRVWKASEPKVVNSRETISPIHE